MMRERELGTQSDRTIDDNRGLIAALEVTAATLAATLIVATLAWQTKHYFAMPFYDDIFDRLRLYRALPNVSALMKYFVSAHNEHRILTTRLFAFLDEFVFSGPLFYTTYYLKTNPNVARAGINPLVHYIGFGGAAGRTTSPAFDSGFYLREYPDVRRDGLNPLQHYICYGEREGRLRLSPPHVAVLAQELASAAASSAIRQGAPKNRTDEELNHAE